MIKKTFNKALKDWMALPSDIKRKILDNVWCSQCRKSVTICDYKANLESEVVVLRGFCSVCGHKVARVLEGCA